VCLDPLKFFFEIDIIQVGVFPICSEINRLFIIAAEMAMCIGPHLLKYRVSLIRCGCSPDLCKSNKLLGGPHFEKQGGKPWFFHEETAVMCDRFPCSSYFGDAVSGTICLGWL
jgi:hypothetical protein